MVKDIVMKKVKNPVYNKFGTINCEIFHDKFGWIPFTATPKDPEFFGRDIYRRILLGEFGEISEYVEPILTTEELAMKARAKRDSLLYKIDEFVLNPLRWESLPVETKDEIASYRNLLLVVPQQNNFPHTINWPETPLVFINNNK